MCVVCVCIPSIWSGNIQMEIVISKGHAGCEFFVLMILVPRKIRGGRDEQRGGESTVLQPVQDQFPCSVCYMAWCNLTTTLWDTGECSCFLHGNRRLGGEGGLQGRKLVSDRPGVGAHSRCWPGNGEPLRLREWRAQGAMQSELRGRQTEDAVQRWQRDLQTRVSHWRSQWRSEGSNVTQRPLILAFWEDPRGRVGKSAPQNRSFQILYSTAVGWAKQRAFVIKFPWVSLSKDKFYILYQTRAWTFKKKIVAPGLWSLSARETDSGNYFIRTDGKNTFPQCPE